jgi:hypothetical protein
MIKPLEYDSNLEFAEAEERLHAVDDEFKKVKSRYSGIFSIFRVNMKEEDKKTLSDCIGVLLPLGLEKAVQAQVSRATSVKETLHYRIGNLSRDIMEYLVNFKNTGVKKYSIPKGLDKF